MPRAVFSPPCMSERAHAEIVWLVLLCLRGCILIGDGIGALGKSIGVVFSIFQVFGSFIAVENSLMCAIFLLIESFPADLRMCGVPNQFGTRA